MSYDACAQLVQSGDPDRFATAMTAPPETRGHLMALYAFNLEVARAPWVTSEPMLAEMRVQWWADALDEIYSGKAPRRHEVVTPLAKTITEMALNQTQFDRLISARRSDIYPDPPTDLTTYISDTSGALMELAVTALGAKPDPAVLQVGYATGLANLFTALPELRARGHEKLADPSEAAISELAGQALEQLLSARSRRREVDRAATPALLCAWKTEQILQTACRSPWKLWQNALNVSDFRSKTGLLLRSATQRW